MHVWESDAITLNRCPSFHTLIKTFNFINHLMINLLSLFVLALSGIGRFPAAAVPELQHYTLPGTVAFKFEVSREFVKSNCFFFSFFLISRVNFTLGYLTRTPGHLVLSLAERPTRLLSSSTLPGSTTAPAASPEAWTCASTASVR